MLTIEQINDILYHRSAIINGSEYTAKEYYYKTAIRKNGKLFAYIDNRKQIDDSSRIKYVTE